MSYAQLAHRSNQVANFLIHQGVRAGDRVLIMLGNVVPLWETMLATIKIGAVTTSKPKLVAHTHTSYPVGHLSTAYWIGLRAGDIHLNLSSPGWAKHAWFCFFAPFNAEATVLAYQYERFSPTALLDQLVRCRVTTFCAPPTVWRMLVQQDLPRWSVSLRELVGAGEPLNPEVIARVQDAWRLTIRDGYGQTETTAQVGNPPGAPLKPGSMGRPLPGYTVALIDADGAQSDEGEICLPLSPPPVG